jgi:hypothetical protein
MRSSFYLAVSVCPPKNLWTKLTDIYETQLRRRAIEYDLDVVLINPLASSFLTRPILKLLRCVQNLHQSTWYR